MNFNLIKDGILSINYLCSPFITALMFCYIKPILFIYLKINGLSYVMIKILS